MPSRSRTVETNWRESSGFSRKASAPDAWPDLGTRSPKRPHGMSSRSSPRPAQCGPRPPEISRSITARFNGSSFSIARAFRRRARRTPYPSVRKKYSDPGRVGVTFRQQYRGEIVLRRGPVDSGFALLGAGGPRPAGRPARFSDDETQRITWDRL